MAAESAREGILARIRSANGAANATPGVGGAAGAWAAIPRAYRRGEPEDREATLALLIDRLRDYDAHAVRTTREGLRACVRALLEERGMPKMVVPRGLPEGVLPEEGEFTEDDGMEAAELDGFAGVLTMGTLAIAETGTLVLQNVPGQGRRAATLVPDYHLCLVEVRDVVRSVPEAIARLKATSTLPTTFVSGPSATADIEMTRIKGVHGPRFLDVALIS